MRLLRALMPLPSAAMSCTAPVSLLTAMQAASTVFFVDLGQEFLRVNASVAPGMTSTTVKPSSFNARMGRCTLGCSKPVTTILLPQCLRGRAAPVTAMLLPSLPQAVK